MPDFTHEIQHGRNNSKVICGVDEVGRGPLAGPVIAAAVILPLNFPPDNTEQIRDSKKNVGSIALSASINLSSRIAPMPLPKPQSRKSII